MEDILLRFPHIGEDIFKELGGRNFCKSMKVSRSWNYFIRNERVLQRAYKDYKAYKNIIQVKIQALTKEIGRYERLVQKKTPFHLAAKRGYMVVCQDIVEYADDKNPEDWDGHTPLHEAAKNGHFSICQLILENVDDKNPKCSNGKTPPHMAANNGHLSVCQLIVENVDDKNPKNKYGVTPLHLAVSYNHVAIKQLFEEAQNKKG